MTRRTSTTSASEVTKGIAQVSLESDVPVVYGIVTAETLDQAIERSGTKAGNKGFDAALTALEMIDLCAPSTRADDLVIWPGPLVWR